MTTPAQVDVIGGNSAGGMRASGSVAARLLSSGFSVNALRTNDVLQKDEWKHFDTTVIQVARQRLVGIGDLISRGLVYNIPNALGKTILEWELVGDMTDAQVSMSGVTQGDNDRVTYDLTGIPLPIVHKDFNLNIRALAASRERGMPLDTTQAQLATRIVSEKLEAILFDGYVLSHGGYSIKGYTNATNRNTGSLAARWDTATGDQIVGDVLAMINKAQEDHMYGPYVLYVPRDYYVAMGDDYKTDSDKTIMQRVKEIPGISDIKSSENLSGGASGEVLLIQMTSDVVDIVNGIQPTMVMWESHGGFVFNFKVMAIMVPRMKSDANNQSGIVHYSVP